MKNYVAKGDYIPLISPYARLAGEAAIVGNIFGVAVDDVANGATGQFATEGIFTLPKNVTQAMTQGQRVFWDNTNKNLTTTSTANVCVGCVTAAALAADTTVPLLIEPSAPAGT